MTLRLKRRASKFFAMSEGRKSQVILLDERRLDIIIQPKLYASDLLDLVASHFKLREKHYFGLGFFDETYHFNWLQGEKRVLDHEFPKKTGLLVLHFSIRFYVETIGLLRDTQTVELFYLNARQAVFRNQIECDVDTVFELAAHVLQASNGDFVSDEETREELKKLPVIPTSTLKAHPSIGFCEDRVIQQYQKLSGSSRGLAIVNYMTIVERLPTYGIHYYNVKDKKDIPWWLGISPKGIAVYDKNDKTTPRRLFTWKHLENLYYRDKKFSIEVHGPKREDITGSHIVHTLSSFNPYEDAVREPAESYDDLSCAITDPTTQVSVSRRTFGASNVDVHAWFASTPQLTKCIWSMAVAQHQFYLDRKQSKSQLPTARSMSEIAADLCRSTTSLPGSLGSDLSRSPSSHSLPSLSNSRYDLTVEQSDSLKAERDMYAALLARREALQDALRKKTEELKAICLQEGELTGELPPETPLARGEQPPLFRRRVGTKFSLSAQKVQGSDQLSNELSQMELEVELQGKITSAAQRLASDKTVSKLVRKQRRQSYTKAVGKLKDMEKKLSDMRKQTGGNTDSASQPPPPTSSSSSSSLTTSGGGGSPSASRTFEGMYHVAAPSSVSEVDIGNVHDLSAGAATLTAHQLHGKLPHRFQNRRQRKGSNTTDDLDSVHSGDSGTASGGGGTAGLVSSTSSGYSSLSPSPSPSLGGARASSASSTSCLWDGNPSTSSLPSTTHTVTRVGRRLASVANCRDDQYQFPDDSSSVDSTPDSYLSPHCSKQDKPDKFSASFCLDEDSAHNRSKHFIVSRGPQRSRLTEVKGRSRESSYSELPSQSRVLIDLAEENSDNPALARLARAEPDHDLDNSCCTTVWNDEDDVGDESSRGCSSFGGDTSFGGDSEEMEEYRLWREEQKFSTRVQRRKQTVILSRSLRRQKVNVIENEYKALENLFMGGAGTNMSGSSGSSNSRSRPLAKNPQAKCVSTGQVRRDIKTPSGLQGSGQSHGELGQSSNSEGRRRNVRSRSFDSSRNSRGLASPRYHTGNSRVNQTFDDIRVPDLSSHRKDSTTSLAKKSGVLFSRGRDRPKQAWSPDSQVECGPPSSQFLKSGCFGGSISPNTKYETNFGVIAGNIKAASSTTESPLPSSTSLCSTDPGSCVLRRNLNVSGRDDCATQQELERSSAGNVTSSTIRDSSSSSISIGSEGCTTPISGASGSGGASSADETEFSYPSNANSWQANANRTLETAV